MALFAVRFDLGDMTRLSNTSMLAGLLSLLKVCFFVFEYVVCSTGILYHTTVDPIVETSGPGSNRK
jgi:hypothetical protein